MHPLRICRAVIAIGLVMPALLLVVSVTFAQSAEPPAPIAPQSSLGNVFTYQGQLKKNNAPITDNCSMAFRLYDQASGGSQIGSPITTTVPITNGLFTVALDFGSTPFAGEARWLGITVRCTADSAYIDLSRQALTAAPYSLYSTSTGALQGRSVANANPATNQVLKWNGSAWVPADDAIGPPGSGDISAVIAGNGLSGGGTTGDVTLTVAFAGSGVANTVARSDHNHNGVYSLIGHTHAGSDITSPVANATNADLLDGQHASAFAAVTHHHLGQTWQGNNNPLVITGTFGAPYYTPLVLGNIHASGSGVRVERAGLSGVDVSSAGHYGVWVSQAGEHGAAVYKAGNPSSLSMSTFPSGFEVEGSEGYGLYVGRSDRSGVYVNSAGGEGVVVNEAGGFGVWVGSTGWDGVSVGSADNNGMHVSSAGWDGVSVGSAGHHGVNVSQAGWDGVHATSTSATYYGGRFLNTAAGGAGLYARGGSNAAPDLVLGGSSDSNDDGRIYSDPTYPGSDIFLVSNDAVQIELDNDNNENGNFWINNGANTTVFAVNESGDMTAIGTKSALVTTQAYGQRKLYALESPQNWFEDFGAAQLMNGQATVAIEPIFAQTVNLTETYHVFLTPLGDCALYVAAKTPTSFTVKALGGQTCSIAFDYRIVAKRLGYETLRLEAATPTEPGGEE